MSADNLHAVILAGGSGQRFWPLSRELMPKQLLRIVGDRTMLALTLDRSLTLVPEARVWVVTTRDQAGAVRQELAALGLSGVRVVEEPSARNTAPAIGLAAHHVLREDPEGILCVFPADHHIEQTDRFTRLIRAGGDLAAAGWLVTLGIPPQRPETGYGYIQRGEPLAAETGRADLDVEAFRVRRFQEKPDRATAEAYLRAGDHDWNGGIFVWRAARFLEETERHLPEHHRILGEIGRRLGEDIASDADRIKELYDALGPISVDYGILEKADRVAVLPAEMGWSDVGSWATLRELLPRDPDGNVLQGDVLALETRDSLVLSEERLVATLGLEGVVVVDTADAVLICSEDRGQEVRRISDALRTGGREEAMRHRHVRKPWGSYKVLDRAERYQVKWLEVLSGQRTSVQSHERRAEHWTVVAGTATVTLGEDKRELGTGEHVHVPAGVRHRLENRSAEPLRIVEVQTGDYLGEDDIVRYEDDYGREGTQT